MKRRNLLGQMAALATGGLLIPGTGYSQPAGPRDPGTALFDVKKYGASGDGKKNDRLSIQKAIDACHAAGGGRVMLDKGTFLSGGLILKDHVDLHLTSSATLLGSSELSDYNHDKNFSHGDGIRSFINAYKSRHVSITGNGKIDGQGQLFTAKQGYSVRPYLLFFRKCEDVKLEDVVLHNSAVWACWMLQCHRVKVESVRIDNPVSPNRDGIDLDGCSEVLISNCNIKTEDDSVAFKVSEKGFPCRNIVVTNCLLSSRCAAIRFGPDAIDNIENVSISNCVIRDTRLNGIKIQESMGAVMRNITFTNIVMDNVRGPISIRCAGWKLEQDETAPFIIDDSNWEAGRLQNILFDNIRGTTPSDNIAMSITGTSKTRPSQITFSNIDITFTGGGTAEQGSRRDVPDLDRHYPEMYIFGELPAYAMYMHHVTGIIFQNVSFRLESSDLRPAVVCDDGTDLEFSHVRFAGASSAESAVRLQDCSGVFFNHTRMLNSAGTFLRIEGASSKDIQVSAPRIPGASKMYELDRGADEKAITVLS